MEQEPTKSVPLMRLLLTLGGVVGLHKVYVNRFPEAFVRLSTAGMGLLGLFYDSFTIEEDVNFFNDGSERRKECGVGKKGHKAAHHVNFSVARFVASFCYAGWLGLLAWAAASLTYAKHDPQGGRMMAGLTIGVTLGVYIAGNCGQQRRSLYEIFFAVSGVMAVTLSPFFNWAPLQAVAVAAAIGTIIGNRTARRAEPSEDRALTRVHFVLWTSIFLMNMVLLADGLNRQCLRREFTVETVGGVKSIETTRLSVQGVVTEWFTNPNATRRRLGVESDAPWQARFLPLPKREPQYLEFLGVSPGAASPAWVEHVSAALVDAVWAAAAADQHDSWPGYVFNRRYLITMLDVAPLSTDALLKKKCAVSRKKDKKGLKKEEAAKLGVIAKTCQSLKL